MRISTGVRNFRSCGEDCVNKDFLYKISTSVRNFRSSKEFQGWQGSFTLLKMGRYYNTTVSLLGLVSKIVSILSVN